MKKLVLLPVIIFLLGLVATGLSCTSCSNNDYDTLLVSFVNHSIAKICERDSTIDYHTHVFTHADSFSTNVSDYSVDIEIRRGSNCSEDNCCDYCEPLFGAEYDLIVPSSYSDEQVERALIDSLVLKKKMPEGVAAKIRKLGN